MNVGIIIPIVIKRISPMIKYMMNPCAILSNKFPIIISCLKNIPFLILFQFLQTFTLSKLFSLSKYFNFKRTLNSSSVPVTYLQRMPGIPFSVYSILYPSILFLKNECRNNNSRCHKKDFTND